MKKHLQILLLLIFLTATRSYSTTWNEPWIDKVIKEANSFILGKVISSDAEKGIRVQVLKTLGGQDLKGTILINNFYSLMLCSSSVGHGAEFHIKNVDSCYFFINKNSKGQFCIATPTTGFDYVNQGNVTATFRHSYHQALVPVFVYEKAMTAVFNNYHNARYDRDYIEKFIQENLSKPPAGFGEDEINTFFLQHVALECIYHLKLNIQENLLLPFFNDGNNFHNQVSAARAMHSSNSEDNKRELLKGIGDTSRRNFTRVICVWSLSDLQPKEFKKELQKFEESASNEADDFGGDVMDPRVCTSIPSLKTALKKLLDGI